MKKKFNAKKILGGSNVVSIESGSFTWDISLEVVEVGKNLEKIDEDAFYHCSQLKYLEE